MSKSASNKNYTVRLKQFNMNQIPDGSIVLFIGKRKTGKSQLVLDFLQHNQDIPVGTVISPTDDYNYTFKPHVPSIFIHDEYSPELINQVLMRQKNICKQCRINPGYKNVDPRAFLCLDDCLADAKDWINDKNIRWIFMNGRHAKLTFLLTMQYAMGITPNLRTNVDYIFICKEPKVSNQKRLFEHYAGIFPDFKMFRAVLSQCTKNYGCLVIDNTSISEKFEDQVFWYRANVNRPGFNDFRVCYPIFWKDNDKYLNSDREDPYRDKEEDTGGMSYDNYLNRNQINFNVKHLGEI
jgi:hypothetical protein